MLVEPAGFGDEVRDSGGMLVSNLGRALRDVVFAFVLNAHVRISVSFGESLSLDRGTYDTRVFAELKGFC